MTNPSDYKKKMVLHTEVYCQAHTVIIICNVHWQSWVGHKCINTLCHQLAKELSTGSHFWRKSRASKTSRTIFRVIHELASAMRLPVPALAANCSTSPFSWIMCYKHVLFVLSHVIFGKEWSQLIPPRHTLSSHSHLSIYILNRLWTKGDESTCTYFYYESNIHVILVLKSILRYS